MEPRLPAGAKGLTDRQREVALLAADGLTNAEIGERLAISLDGAKYHVSEVLARLNLERREQITEWASAQRSSRPRRGILLVALGGAGATVMFLVVIALVAFNSATSADGDRGDAPVELASATSAQPEPTLVPSSEPESGSAPEPPGRALVADLWEPFTWDDSQGVQRIPPPTEAAALEERDIHRDGYPAADEPLGVDGVAGGDGCEPLSLGVPVRVGDWVAFIDGTGVTARMALLPRTAEPEGEERVQLPFLVRWIELDSDPERTHVHEQFWGGPDGSFEFPLSLPAVGSWRGVATYGPNWGCFTLEITEATLIPRLIVDAEAQGRSFPLPSSSEAERVRFDSLLGQMRGLGTAARQCVDADAALWVRSGEIAARLEQVQANWSPNRRASKVGFGVLGQEDLGPLVLLGAMTNWPFHTYSYVEPRSVESVSAESGERLGSFGYVASITPPRVGEWLLTVEAQPTNWGCFTVSVG